MKTPNILLLHTDQQRFDTIRALGADHVDTPNLDRLAGIGTSFTQAYSSNPVCMPARHDLISGKGRAGQQRCGQTNCGQFPTESKALRIHRGAPVMRFMVCSGVKLNAPAAPAV